MQLGASEQQEGDEAGEAGVSAAEGPAEQVCGVMYATASCGVKQWLCARTPRCMCSALPSLLLSSALVMPEIGALVICGNSDCVLLLRQCCMTNALIAAGPEVIIAPEG